MLTVTETRLPKYSTVLLSFNETRISSDSRHAVSVFVTQTHIQTYSYIHSSGCTTVYLFCAKAEIKCDSDTQFSHTVTQ